jgi:hypothetical protein
MEEGGLGGGVMAVGEALGRANKVVNELLTDFVRDAIVNL